MEDFRCEGSVGPPCTVFREDTVTLDVDWNNPGIKDMSQSAHWVSWMDIPWVGLETEVCPYLDGGLGCGNSTVGQYDHKAGDTEIFLGQTELLPVSDIHRANVPRR